jgi:hypothetical protein
MTHLKHASPIRRAAQMKRTALVEIYSDEAAVNATTFEQIEAEANAEARAIVSQPTEAQRIAADLAEPSGWVKAARDADRAQAVEIQRMTNGGFLNV